MTWYEYYTCKGTVGTKIEEIVIDNADYILQEMCREKISKITMTKEQNMAGKQIKQQKKH